MRKKIIYTLIFLFFFAFVSADVIMDESLFTETKIENEVSQEFLDNQASNLGDISVRFCNDGVESSSLALVVEGGEKNEICMDFLNYMNSDVVIKYSFVDGIITDDQYKNKACTADDMDKFGKYVAQDYSEITIPANDKVQQKAYLTLPGGMSGIVNGCLVYSIVDSNKVDSDSMFTIQVRKAAFIDVSVGGEMSRKLELSEGNNVIDMHYDRKGKVLKLNIPFNNLGNINENVSLQGHISNAFGYNQDFSGVVKALSNEISEMIVEIPNIPRYKMGYKINLDFISNGDFEFDVSSLPSDLSEPITISAITSVFIFPWSLFFIFVGVILLIVLVRFLLKHLKFQK